MARQPDELELPTCKEGRLVNRGDSAGLVYLANALLKHARLIGTVALSLAFLTGALVLVLPRRYTAQGSFVVEQQSQSRLLGSLAAFASLAGFAEQFGLALPSEAARSPQFYAELLRSREVTDAVLLSRFQSRGDSARLLSLLGVRGKSLADSLYRGRRRMAKRLEVRLDQRTGIVTVAFTSPYPELSAAVVNRYFELLNTYNLETRQSLARRRREFVEARVAAANTELRAAEERLKNFVERNRLWQQWPQLALEYERLQREVQVAQEVYLTLRREYEEARVEEVNDTPILTVVDSAVVPVRHSYPRRGVSVILALVLGIALGIAAALTSEYLARLKREGSGELEELEGRLRRLVPLGVKRPA